MRVKAVIFDLDGTLRDTRDIIYAAAKHAVREHGGPQLADDEIADYMHHHSNVHKQFASHVSLAEFERVFHGKLFELLPSVSLYKNAAEIIAELHDNGYKLAIVSSAGTKDIRHFLHRVGIDAYFDGITGVDGNMPHKPSPEPVLDAIHQLGTTAQECIMVGDMHVDMEAAQAAGVPVKVGITHGFESARSLKAAGADYIIDSLDALPGVLDGIK